MQGMAKLVKQRARIVITQQRRISLGKVADVDHYRPLHLWPLGLTSHGRAPSPRSLGPTREIIPNKNSNMRAIARHFPGPAIRVIERHIKRAKLQPKQPIGTAKCRRDHRLQRQIGFQGRFIQIMLRLPPLFCIVTPIPRLQFSIDSIGLHHLRQPCRIPLRLRLGRFPNRHQQAPHRLWRLGHLGFQLVGGKIRIAQQGGPLRAQPQNLCGDLAIVSLTSHGTARNP